MKHGSLFSGIGGFDLAAQWMGWENIFHCEWAEFPRKVLKKNFQNSITYEDITKTDFNVHRGNIDILTGGFPCQPFSQAGKRKGIEDERYLWGEMLRAIQEIKPKWIVGENVYGIINISRGMVFQQVCIDLENEGYSVQPIILPAVAKNAPHRRDRVWFVAHSNSERWVEIGLQSRINTKKHEQRFINDDGLFSGIKQSSEYVRGDDGLSTELDAYRVKALGNAIVPQVAYEIFKCIGLLAAAPLTLKTNGA